jgi:hypothetical protein
MRERTGGMETGRKEKGGGRKEKQWWEKGDKGDQRRK